MSLVDIEGRIELASLDWAVEVRVADVPVQMAERLKARWRGLSSPAPPSAVAASAAIEVLCVDAPIGLAGDSPLVEVAMTWSGDRRGTLRAVAVEAEVELGPHRLSVRARISAARARGALESLFRAVAALSLARRRVLLLHASAVTSPGGALVFLGASGAGKTTTARRLGREGFRRLADDMIAVDVAHEPPRLHLLPFERSGQWAVAAREVFTPPACLAAGLVAKGLPLSVEPAREAVRAWAEARLALPCAPGDERATLDDFTRLCRIPVFRVGVPPSGPLTALARGMIENVPRKRLDEGQAVGHPAAAAPAAASPMAPTEALAAETSKLTRAPNVAWRVLDGQAVLVAPSSPLVHTLNSVGTLVWELADGRTVSSIVDAVVNEFAVTRTEAKADVELFVRELLNKHLITVTGTG